MSIEIAKAQKSIALALIGFGLFSWLHWVLNWLFLWDDRILTIGYLIGFGIILATLIFGKDTIHVLFGGYDEPIYEGGDDGSSIE